VAQYSSNKQTWIEIPPRRASAFTTDSFFGNWDTTKVPNGDYFLHVRVVDKGSNYGDSCDLHVTVKNP
jgi:hypothetical protein